MFDDDQERILFEVSSNFKEHIRQKARSQGVSLSSYLRSLVAADLGLVDWIDYESQESFSLEDQVRQKLSQIISILRNLPFSQSDDKPDEMKKEYDNLLRLFYDLCALLGADCLMGISD